MAKTVYYRQCKLEKKMDENRTCHQVSYIPSQYAIEGKVLKLRDSDKNWDNGWVVTSAGNNLYEDKEILDSHEVIKGHRKMTGDSERKK